MNDFVTRFKQQIKEAVDTNPGVWKLTRVSKVGSLPGDVKEILQELYSQEEPKCQMLATVLNAIFTEKKTRFLMTRKLFEELAAKDHRSTRDYASGRWAEFGSWVSKINIITIVSPSSPGKAAVWELASPDLTKILESMVGAERIRAQREEVDPDRSQFTDNSLKSCDLSDSVPQEILQEVPQDSHQPFHGEIHEDFRYVSYRNVSKQYNTSNDHDSETVESRPEFDPESCGQGFSTWHQRLPNLAFNAGFISDEQRREYLKLQGRDAGPVNESRDE